MDNNLEITVAEETYFDKRMAVLGITPDINKISLWQATNDVVRDEKGIGKTKEELVEVPIFRQVDEGIEILVYTLDRLSVRIEKPGSRQKKDFTIVRLEKPLVKKGNDIMKYRLPKGGGNYPFFPPALIEKFDRREEIETLYLVEGYFKAFKASMHGADIVGLSSITHMKDKDKGCLHRDIIKLLDACKVKRCVWLTDGDCLDITSKELKDGLDLYRRPRGFFSSVETFSQLLIDFKDVEPWFFHIDTDYIVSSFGADRVSRDQVKGIDDLLITFSGREKAIIDDMLAFSKSSSYFQRFPVRFNMTKVYHHFHLSNVNDFYLFHVERRPELKNVEFKFVGTSYRYDEIKQECIVVAPGEAKHYFRVGDTYHKFIYVPNKFNQLERRFVIRQKGTIQDDHGKGFTVHIPKYEAFCNVPNHRDFQQIINNTFNLYNPIEHDADEVPCAEDDCPTIIKFIQHIFGTKEIIVKSPKGNGPAVKVPYYQLALDYLQLLYTSPIQKLPIICLVSKENETGKSTFAMLLKNIFTSNAAIVGNADLADNFNSHWASKLIIICDETKIDKQSVMEKVKSLSTADKVMMNAKGKDHVELDFFGKFMFLTNNEDNFITASDEDLRFWVIKVPKLREKNPDLQQIMLEEIPAFLSLLLNRKMITEKCTRMWFDPALLRTEALRRVIDASKPVIEKELRQYLRDTFMDFGLDEIWMCRKDIHKEVFNNKYEANYLESTLKDRLLVEPYHVYVYNEREFPTQKEALNLAYCDNPDTDPLVVQDMVKKKGKTVRYSYTVWTERYNEGHREMVRTSINSVGRPYVFKRSDFISDEEWQSNIRNPADIYLNKMEPDPNAWRPVLEDAELPFPQGK